MSTARTVYDRIREDRGYPDVQTYKLTEVHTERDVPNNFNGPNGDPISFRCANIMEVGTLLFLLFLWLSLLFTALFCVGYCFAAKTKHSAWRE